MSAFSILLQSLPYSLAATSSYFGKTHVSGIDARRIAASGLLYFIFNRINNVVNKESRAPQIEEEKKPLPFIPQSEDALFLKNASRNALAISLAAVDYKPSLRAISVYVCVPEHYQELFANVFEALINATNEAAIDTLGMKEDAITPYRVGKKIAINTAGIFIGWGVNYGIRTYVCESEYLAAFISGFAAKALNIYFTDTKAIKDEDIQWAYIMHGSMTRGVGGIVGVAANTYFPTTGIGFAGEAIAVTFLDRMQDYAVELLVETPSFVKALPNTGKEAFPELSLS